MKMLGMRWGQAWKVHEVDVKELRTHVRGDQLRGGESELQGVLEQNVYQVRGGVRHHA